MRGPVPWRGFVRQTVEAYLIARHQIATVDPVKREVAIPNQSNHGPVRMQTGARVKTGVKCPRTGAVRQFLHTTALCGAANSSIWRFPSGAGPGPSLRGPGSVAYGGRVPDDYSVTFTEMVEQSPSIVLCRSSPICSVSLC